MKTDRAYSLMTFEKAVDEDQRVIKGIASTPTPDRSNDIVDPEGAMFKLPIPLLSQHDHSKPIGEVTEAKVTKRGIEITAKIAKGIGYVDEAWAQIKQGLIKGLSIGFRGTEYEEFKNANGYGLHFKKWEWYELSAVTVPANAEASISMVKSLATPGNNGSTRKTPARDLGKTVSINSPQKATEMKTLADQIKGFEARKTELANTVKSILDKAADESRTLDATEAEAHDTALDEIKQVELHIGRLKSAEAMQISTATPVAGDTQKAAIQSRAGIITVKDNLAPGQRFARYAKCLAASKGNLMQAQAIAQSQYPDDVAIHNTIKAAVAAGTTTDPTWAGPLVEYQTFLGDFREYLRPMTILGKFGQGGIPALRAIPFNVKIHGANAGGSAGWVGEGKAKPVTSFGFDTVNHGWAKIAAISVLTEELLRLSTPAADLLVRDLLTGALVEHQDLSFVDPTKAAVSGVSPASITNGVTAVAASGVDADAVRTDVKALMQKFIDAKVAPTTGVWMMNPSMALALSMMYDALGRAEFPGITMLGGTFMGFPVIVSEQIAATDISMVVASELYLSEDSILLDASREASILMDTAPNMNSGTPTAAQMVSMFQTNSVALRVEKYVNWSKRRAASVQRISGANYGGTAEE
jgi:HK97 family phage major capsid protein/HK97 family phage prohead protease